MTDMIIQGITKMLSNTRLQARTGNSNLSQTDTIRLNHKTDIGMNLHSLWLSNLGKFHLNPIDKFAKDKAGKYHLTAIDSLLQKFLYPQRSKHNL